MFALGARTLVSGHLTQECCVQTLGTPSAQVPFYSVRVYGHCPKSGARVLGKKGVVTLAPAATESHSGTVELTVFPTGRGRGIYREKILLSVN